MSTPYQDLAARFRTAVRQQQAQQEEDTAQEQALADAAHRAREELLNQLEDFATAADFFQVVRSAKGISLKYKGRRLRFDVDRRSAGVMVRSATLKQAVALEYDPRRGVWRMVYKGRQRRPAVDLFPNGLEQLITSCFDIRPAAHLETFPPEDVSDEEPRPRRRERPGSRFWR